MINELDDLNGPFGDLETRVRKNDFCHFMTEIFLLFLILKLTDVINWSWWIICLPVYFLPAIIIVCLIIYYCLAVKNKIEETKKKLKENCK